MTALTISTWGLIGAALCFVAGAGWIIGWITGFSEGQADEQKKWAGMIRRDTEAEMLKALVDRESEEGDRG